EVDLVLEQGRDIYGIDVKKAASIQAKDGEGLKRLAAQAGKSFKGGVLLYCGNNALPLKTENCIAAPMTWLWQNDFL
ncbi:MAG: AAA family ATPase, partial [Idiomarinaceae bacterium]|nr:AAA family ATPase [Idiomarinaceae bacterium]